MADYFCDNDAYATKLGDVPTNANWASPQEGDGSSKYSTSAVSSVASITINGGAAAAAGNTIQICGVTFTGQVAARTAGSATFTIGSTAVNTADGIVAAINDCTTAVNAGSATGVPRISNLMYARGPAVRGDTNAVVDIMMRVGSASLNYSINTNVLITSNGFATAPTVVNFANGVGGCWGVLANVTAIGVGANYAIASYGVASSNSAWRPMVAVNSGALTTQALQGFSDFVWVRSRAGYRLSFTANLYPQFHHTFHENIILDSNTKWTEDTGNGQVELYITSNNSLNQFNMAATSMARSLACIKQYSLRILAGSLGPGNGSFSIIPLQGGGGSCGVHNVYFGEEKDYVVAGFALPVVNIGLGGNFCNSYFSGCMLDLLTQRTAASVNGWISGSITGNIAFDDCTFYANFISAIDPGPVTGVTIAGEKSSVKFRNCQFKGAPSSQGSQYRCLNTQSALGLAEIVFENCSGVKLDTYIGFQTTQSGNNPTLPSLFISSADTGHAFRHENVQGVSDWNPLASPAYPLLAATQADGTRWSMKVDWLYYTATFGVSEGSPYMAPKLSLLYRDTTAARTITLDMLVKSTLSMTALNSSMRVVYTDSTGLVRSESTRLKPSTLQTSDAVWTRANASDFSTHTAKKFVLTTTNTIKTNTDVSVYFNLYKPSPSGVAEQIFLDPEFKIV